MRTAWMLLAATLAAAPLAAQVSPAQPSLDDAQSALSDALARRDRAAFERLVAPDALFLIPGAIRGADAILKAWTPFLTGQGLAFAITPGQTSVAGSGELGYSTGRFTITNPNTNVPQQGEYVAVWRLVDGSWRIASLGGGASTVVNLGGVGGYRFGMTMNDVRQVTDCQPYTNVSQTGGLECRNYMFEGQRINISFIPQGGRLRRIQFWLYEGENQNGAREAVARAIDYLRRVAGEVNVAVAPGEVTPDRVIDTLTRMPPRADGSSQFDITTVAGPQPVVWFGRVGRVQGYYFVFLFAEPRQGF